MRILLSLGLLLLFSVNLTAQNGLDNFWDLFKKNDYKAAISELENKTVSDPTNQEAWLMLTILYDNDLRSYKAMQAFKSFYKLTDKKTEYLVAFWRTTAIYSSRIEQRKEREAFFAEILADPAVDGAIKSNIHGARGNWAYDIGDFEGHLSEIEQSGSLSKWQVVGEFENISASGFDKNYSPINQPTLSARFKNKQEADVHWFKSEIFRTGEWIRPAYHFDTDNAIIFAQSFVNSQVDQEVELRIGTSGSLKAWVNDCLVLSESEEYDNYADTYRTKIKLKKGNNRLLLQIGSSEISSQNFMVRITDEKGNPLNNFTHSANYGDYPKVGGENLNRIELPQEVYFEEQVKNNPENLLYYILLSRIYLDNGKTNQAQRVLKKAEKLAPDNTLILVELLELYIDQGNETELGAATEKLKMIEPDNRLSLILEFNEAISNENYDEAEDLLEGLRVALGENGSYLEKKIKLESARENNQKVLDIIEEGYTRYPNDETFVNYMYLIKKDADVKGAQKVLKKYLKKHYSSSIQRKYAWSWYNRKMIEQFFTEYKKLLEVKPYAIGLMIDLADYYYQLNRHQTALNYLDDAIELAPFVGNLYSKKGEILMDMENESEALEHFKKAIIYDPTDFDARQRIRDIEGVENPFDYFVEKDYYEIYKNAPSAEDYPEDNSVIVTREKQVVIHEKGAVEERHFSVIKVFDKAGVDFWKEYSIQRSGSQKLIIEKAEVLKADGTKNVAETSGNYCVFTNLEPGDGIFLSYKFQNYYQGNLAEHYWGKQYFDYFIPSKNIEFSILYDEKEVPVKFSVANGEINKEEKNVDGKTVIIYSSKDNESIKSEGFMPPLVDIGRTLHYSSMPDWSFVSEWYSDLAATKAKVDFEVKESVKTLFPDGTDGLTEREMISDIYGYIVNEIRYSSISFRQSGLVPQKASDVITTKIGDCKDVSTLFVAMCEEVGIDAGLVLVNTRNKGQHAMELPSIEFNHCIAKVNLEGEEKFVELTTDLYPFSTVSSSLEGSFILEIDPTNKDIQPRFLPRSKSLPNAIYRTTEVQLTENKMIVKKDNVKTGASGGGMRSSYRDDGEEARKKSMQEAITGDFANIKLDNVEFDETLENNSDSVAYKYDYTVSNPYTKIGSLQIVKVPITDNVEPIDFLSVDDRKYGVELWKYFSFSVAVENLSITMPEGKRLAEKPENVSLSNELIDYELSFKVEAGVLKVYRKIHFKQSKIELADYQLFKDSMEKIITADNLQIGIK
ncbi:MAG: cytochrome c-type biogenesis protein CcmH/NrfG [Crocinitomix sp.]|jgi:cytochrome c-type biogenesis protein CcmH/NrfG